MAIDENQTKDYSDSSHKVFKVAIINIPNIVQIIMLLMNKQIGNLRREIRSANKTKKNHWKLQNLKLNI